MVNSAQGKIRSPICVGQGNASGYEARFLVIVRTTG